MYFKKKQLMMHLKNQQRNQAVLSAYFLCFLLEGKNTIVTNVLHDKVEEIKEKVKPYLKNETSGYVHKFVKELFVSWTDFFLGDKKMVSIHFHENWSLVIATQTLISLYATDCMESSILLIKKQEEFLSSTRGEQALVEAGCKKDDARNYFKSALTKIPEPDPVS